VNRRTRISKQFNNSIKLLKASKGEDGGEKPAASTTKGRKKEAEKEKNHGKRAKKVPGEEDSKSEGKNQVA